MDLSEDSLKGLYDVFQSLKHLEDNCANDDGRHDEDGESEASKKVDCCFVDGEAVCRSGSEDEVFHDKDYNNREDKDFIDDREDQQHDTGAHHRRCDNERRGDHFQEDLSASVLAFAETMPCEDDFDMALGQDVSNWTDLGVPEIDLGFGPNPNLGFLEGVDWTLDLGPLATTEHALGNPVDVASPDASLQ